MSANGSTVVLVHGAWHGAWAWDRVVPLLEARGLTVRTLTLPSIDAAADDPGGLAADAAAVGAVLDEAGGASLLLGHSYGGMVITEAAAGRSDIGRLVYLCAFVPDAGESLASFLGGQMPPWFSETPDGRVVPNPAMSAAAFYADCDSDTQQWAVGHIRPMPGKPFGDPATEGSWHRIPSTYIVCAEDAALPPEVQRNVFAPRTAETVEMQVSHSPFLSQPQALADLLAARVR